MVIICYCGSIPSYGSFWNKKYEKYWIGHSADDDIRNADLPFSMQFNDMYTHFNDEISEGKLFLCFWIVKANILYFCTDGNYMLLWKYTIIWKFLK